MVIELVLVGIAYSTYKYLKVTGFRYKKEFRELVEKAGLYNKKEQTLRVHKVTQLEYGYRLNCGVPYGIGLEDIQQLEDTFKTNLEATEVRIERAKGKSMVNITVITKPLTELVYEPVNTEPYEIYPGFNHTENRRISLNKQPHVLVGGSTGSGKSRLMLCILTNLITNHRNIDLYILQLRKGDLKVFSRCKQVKYFADKLQKARDVLSHINNLCIERDGTIDKYIFEGIYNIEDYNKRFKTNQLSYVHVVTDEFAFFIPSKADQSDEKKLKQECLAYIKNIILTGRSVGVFIYTSLQRPDKSSIPADIKAQLNVRISFKQRDDSSSIAILGNGNATNLKEREAILQLTDEEIIRVPFIDDGVIKKYISDSIEPNHQYITLTENKEFRIDEVICNENQAIDSEVLKNVDFEGF
jgi:DNA segregation ATPase FtsK/SpoIIIE-like protein